MHIYMCVHIQKYLCMVVMNTLYEHVCVYNHICMYTFLMTLDYICRNSAVHNMCIISLSFHNNPKT